MYWWAVNLLTNFKMVRSKKFQHLNEHLVKGYRRRGCATSAAAVVAEKRIGFSNDPTCFVFEKIEILGY